MKATLLSSTKKRNGMVAGRTVRVFPQERRNENINKFIIIHIKKYININTYKLHITYITYYIH